MISVLMLVFSYCFYASVDAMEQNPLLELHSLDQVRKNMRVLSRQEEKEILKNLAKDISKDELPFEKLADYPSDIQKEITKIWYKTGFEDYLSLLKLVGTPCSEVDVPCIYKVIKVNDKTVLVDRYREDGNSKYSFNTYFFTINGDVIRCDDSIEIDVNEIIIDKKFTRKNCEGCRRGKGCCNIMKEKLTDQEIVVYNDYVRGIDGCQKTLTIRYDGIFSKILYETTWYVMEELSTGHKIVENNKSILLLDNKNRCISVLKGLRFTRKAEAFPSGKHAVIADSYYKLLILDLETGNFINSPINEISNVTDFKLLNDYYIVIKRASFQLTERFAVYDVWSGERRSKIFKNYDSHCSDDCLSVLKNGNILFHKLLIDTSGNKTFKLNCSFPEATFIQELDDVFIRGDCKDIRLFDSKTGTLLYTYNEWNSHTFYPSSIAKLGKNKIFIGCPYYAILYDFNNIIAASKILKNGITKKQINDYKDSHKVLMTDVRNYLTDENLNNVSFIKSQDTLQDAFDINIDYN